MVDLGVSQQIISAEQRKRYESDGYLHLNGFVDTGSLEELRNCLLYTSDAADE